MTARKYFDGVLMAYRDCAEEAERLVTRQVDFVETAVAAGAKRNDAELVSSGAETVLKQFAKSIRVKLATVEEMIATDPGEIATGRQRGGFARAASMTPEKRTETAKKAAKARWDKH